MNNFFSSFEIIFLYLKYIELLIKYTLFLLRLKLNNIIFYKTYFIISIASKNGNILNIFYP